MEKLIKILSIILSYAFEKMRISKVFRQYYRLWLSPQYRLLIDYMENYWYYYCIAKDKINS